MIQEPYLELFRLVYEYIRKVSSFIWLNVQPIPRSKEATDLLDNLPADSGNPLTINRPKSFSQALALEYKQFSFLALIDQTHQE